MSDAKLTLIGFYQFDKMVDVDFFENLKLPEAIDHDTIVYTILDRGGEYETILSDPDFLKSKMLAWSNSWYNTFEKWVAVLAKDYDPLENYDRIESWNDTGKTRGNDSTNTHNHTGTIHNVSAMDSSSLVGDDANDIVNDVSSATALSTDVDNVHEGRVHGNIGVTTSDQMLASHMRTRLEWGNIYNHIADLFLHDFVIPIG